jgi:hypothetical protein
MNVVVTALLLGSSLIGQAVPGQRQLEVGDRAPDVPLLMLGGSPMRLSGFRNRIILLDFFRTG